MTAVPGVSVIVPARNEESIIAECIEALLAQTEPVDEIIVVDNGSTDLTAEVAARFPRVRVIHEARPGIAAARAAGFDAASHELIGRIDADTVVDPDWAAVVRRTLTGPGAPDAVGGQIRQVHAGPVGARASELLYRAFVVFHRALFRAPALLYGHNMALTREAWQRVGADVSRDERGNEDIDVALAIRRAGGTVRFVPQLRAQADLRRTLSPRKLARYLRGDSATRRKYELLSSESSAG